MSFISQKPAFLLFLGYNTFHSALCFESFWSVCRKVVCFVCFAVVLHRKKVFFKFAASPPNFSLILLKTTFLLVFGEVTLFLYPPSENNVFLFFHEQTTHLTLYITGKMFSLLCLKYVAFRFIAGKTCFGVFAVTLGCSQRYCNGKRFSPSLQ